MWSLATQPKKRAICDKIVDILQQSFIDKVISGCIRMACGSLLTTGYCKLSTDLLQIDFQNMLSTG